MEGSAFYSCISRILSTIDHAHSVCRLPVVLGSVVFHPLGERAERGEAVREREKKAVPRGRGKLCC
jgi:hypothetical protein